MSKKDDIVWVCTRDGSWGDCLINELIIVYVDDFEDAEIHKLSTFYDDQEATNLVIEVANRVKKVGSRHEVV